MDRRLEAAGNCPLEQRCQEGDVILSGISADVDPHDHPGVQLPELFGQGEGLLCCLQGLAAVNADQHSRLDTQWTECTLACRVVATSSNAAATVVAPMNGLD